VGQKYLCSYAIQDTDQFHDGITLSDIDDVVTTATGKVDSLNILGSLSLIFDPGIENPAAMPSCTGGTGLGTTTSPYVNATSCTIPWDAGIETENYSFYTAKAGDYNLPGHLLTDLVAYTWTSLCSAPGGSGISCPVGPQSTSIGGSSAVQQLPSDTTTTVRDSADAVVTGPITLGTTVHDAVTVAADPSAPTGSPTPTGTVTISWFTNSSCSGTASSTSGQLTLGTNGQVDATSFNFTPATGGGYAFEATYNGDPSDPAYLTSTGSCEPITIEQPDLSITKTADATTVSTGTPIGFTITVANSSLAGTGTATAVTLSDPLPSGSGIDWSISPAYAGPGTCVINGTVGSQTLTCSLGDLAAGASASVHISSTTVFASAGTYINTATASAANAPPITATAKTAVDAPNLAITKTADASPVPAGGPIGYTIAVSNSSTPGTGTATGVTVNDPLPDGTNVDWTISPAYSGPGTCVINGAVGSQVLTCSLGNLALGASASVHIQSATTFASGGTYVNTATASATNAPPVQATATIVVPPPPVLSVTKTADATPVSTGTSIGYTITIANGTGATTATGVTLNDPLPAGPGINWSISPTYTGPGTCAITGPVGTQVLTCNFGSLAGGASISVHISSPTTTTSAGTYANTATVSTTNGPPVQATATIVVQPPDLSIVKTPDAGSVPAGSAIGYTVTVSNSPVAGTGTATDVMLNDPLPAGSGVDWFISPTYAGPGTCAITGPVGTQVLTCNFGDLAPGTSASVHISSATTNASVGTYKNTATASAGNAANITATATITVLPVDITITKVADASAVTAGSPIGYTIKISNLAGDGTAAGVTLNDPLPAGPGIDWSISPTYAGPGTCTITGPVGTQVLACNIGSLVGGDSASVHIVSGTTVASVGSYVNTATASATNAATVTASATVVVHLPNIHTVLTDTPSAKKVASGTSVTFTYTESNTGLTPISGVTVTGSVCGSATFVKSSDGNKTILDPGATWTFTCTTTLTNTGKKTIKVVDIATASGTNTLTNMPAPAETAKATVKVSPAAGCGLAVTVSPNPLVETGTSQVDAVVQVEACAIFAGDTVNIVSQQLGVSCSAVVFSSLQPGAVAGLNSIQVTLDNDGNVTVMLTGSDCAPGSSLIEADLVHAPYLTATTTLVATPPAVTTSGVFGFPPNEVETGDTTASGFSDVYSVFYVETDPVYAETTVQITSPELASRCLGGVTWTSNQGTFTGDSATATIDNDGNAVFEFKGASCASGTSTVTADVTGGAHTTYTTTYTILPPQVTPS
jgi:uncharacterized repeat protein (TIGR01451 family)